MRTPSMEDYLEAIFNLIREKGYARVADVAELLGVHPSSVTKMVQKLDEHEYVKYERYRGFVLTSKGKKLGRRLADRHELLEEFLQRLGVPDSAVARDVEGMEHHVSPETLDALGDLLRFFAEHPEVYAEFLAFRARASEDGEDEREEENP
ncbi:transcriptional regulator MntR [Brockia lithotrophica]|uniref:Manganese transport regulator n=1 Tax=Brockia lithotrophica TaxID=933949 RepID=A0A660L5Y7_9BACL|nr:transcriptional regulator MntR [Brockia lithotrophica]RKQ88755.1 DtxR family iron (metal) dependent repressor [Brockia lithotrophica]